MADTVQANLVDLVDKELEDAKAHYEQIKGLFQRAEQRVVEAQVTKNFLGRLVIPQEGSPPLVPNRIVAEADVVKMAKEQMD